MNQSDCRTYLNSCINQRVMVRVVSDKEMDAPEFIRDVVNLAAGKKLRPTKLLDFIFRELDKRECVFVIGKNKNTELNFDWLEPSDAEIDADLGDIARKRRLGWIADRFCTPVPDHVTPQLEDNDDKEDPDNKREWFRNMATALKAIHPAEAMMWGIRGANDNETPGQ